MIYTTLLYTVRNLKRNKLSSAINITGFSIGIAAFLLIVSYIKYEKGYDSFYLKADNLYRIGINFINGGNTVQGSMVQFPVGPALKNEYEEVEEYTRVWSNYNITMTYGDKEFFEPNIFNVDSNFPNMFCRMISGDAKECLNSERNIIISEEIAKKYFGDADPIGNHLRLSGYGEHKVTGVFKSRSNMSHFNFEILVPISHIAKNYTSNWDSHNFYTYIRLRDGVKVKDFVPKLNEMQERYNAERLKATGIDEEYFFEPITSIRLYSDSLLDFKQNGHGHFIPLFVLIAIIILSFATFNYFNFSSFQAIEKAKTIGINRILGAQKPAIISLFLVESLVFILISTIIGGLMAILLFPKFSNFYDMTYDISLVGSLWFWTYLGFIILINTIVSGVYPAILSFSFKLNEVISGKGRGSKAGALVRPTLAILQYAVSCLLMIFSLVSYYQIQFMRSHDLGFDKDNVLVTREPVILKDSIGYAQTYRMIKDATAQIPGVEEISYSDYVPGGQYQRFDRVKQVGKEGIVDTYMNSVSHNFIDFYKIKLLAGRNFSIDNISDYDNAIIINEQLADRLGFTPKEAIEQQIEFNGKKNIIGVISNFHQESLKKEIAPCLFFVTDWPGYFSFKLSGTNMKATIDAVGGEWNKVFPGNPFNFFFLDQYFDKNYSKDNKAWQILRLSSGLAIFISVLGLWGAVVHQMRQSTKKIAMFKVLGASQGEIFWIFLKKTSYLIGIAFLVGLPVDILFLQSWLSSFPYRIELSISHFVIPLIVLVLITLGTIGSQIFRVVSSNLVYALKSE